MLLSCPSFMYAVDYMLREFSKPAMIYNKVEKPVRDNVKLSALLVGHATYYCRSMTKKFYRASDSNNVAQILRRHSDLS